MPEKDERLLRVGMLGCGPIAQAAHFDACTKARNATLHAIIFHGADGTGCRGPGGGDLAAHGLSAAEAPGVAALLRGLLA